MKKLFFFRSNSSNSRNSNQISPSSTDKQVYWEKPSEKVKKYRVDESGTEGEVFGSAPCLRRSLSLSSGSLHNTGKGLQNQNGSPCNNTSYYSHKQSRHGASRSRAQTPERQIRMKCTDAAMVNNNAHRLEKTDSWEDMSSCSSSNVSNNVLDRYIDGEQLIERNKLNPSSTMRTHQFENGNAAVERPPRFPCTAPISHMDDAWNQKPKSLSFRETKASQLQLPSRDWIDNGFCKDSPRKLAKDVVERLSNSQLLRRTRSKEESDPVSPITIEDVYSRTLNRHSIYTDDEVSPKHSAMDRRCETLSDGSHPEESSGFLEKEFYFGKAGDNTDTLMDTDLELFKKFKEAEKRAAIFREELERDNFLHQFRGLSLPVLVQTIRSLTEDKVSMAQEVSAVLQDRIAEKALLQEELKLARADLDTQTRRLEKEKNELQLALEKELDRRSSEWSLKLEQYQVEERRLRERVRELAEQNVCLQREVSSFREKEVDTRTKLTDSEKRLKDLSIQVKEAREETHYLQKNLSEMQYNSRTLAEDRDCIRRNFQDKINECTDMHQAITRLQRTSNDQEKTIDGLRGLCEELGKKESTENKFDFGIAKLQVEHMRLVGVELALRKEVESLRVEVDSLRRENIDLLNRLKDHHGKDGVVLATFILDRELQNRISYLENQVLPLLKESSQLGRKLYEYAKTTATKKEPVSCVGLDGQALVECEVKLQGLDQAAECIMSSLQTMSSVLHEKSSTVSHENFCTAIVDAQTPNQGDESNKHTSQKTEDLIRSKLKAETLLTRLLREKLYSKELEIEQLQAELAAAVRGSDILKCEVQNAMDSLSCVKHTMQDLELQIMRKDEHINQLQLDLQACKKESAILRGILPKVSEERDLMWQEVKQYSEKNMLLNSEVKSLKKKIESLDEDILLKEGQISILKDTIGKPFDLLGCPDSTENFSWKDTC